MSLCIHEYHPLNIPFVCINCSGRLSSTTAVINKSVYCVGSTFCASLHVLGSKWLLAVGRPVAIASHSHRRMASGSLIDMFIHGTV